MHGTTIVGALEEVWAEIQAAHPQTPDAILTTGSGAKARSMEWGHFHPKLWSEATGAGRVHQVFVSGERLAQGPESTLGTLLHEAAHGIAHATGVQDTSRQGRYHNRRFASIAKGLGLTVETQGSRGLARTALAEGTADAYTSMARLETALVIGGLLAADPETATPKRQGNPLYECGCARKIRVAQSVADEAPIFCGACEEPFAKVLR